MTKNFLYHGPSNEVPFDYRGGYGFSQNTRYKFDNPQISDVYYVIQKLRNGDPLELVGKFELVGKKEEPDKGNPKEKRFRLQFRELSKVSIPVQIDEDEFTARIGEEAPEPNYRWTPLTTLFCHQANSGNYELGGKTVAALEDLLSPIGDSVLIFNEEENRRKDEKRKEKEIEHDSSLSDTDKVALVKSRRGQGKYKNNLTKIERHCRLTGTTNLSHLRASHIKPWAKSTNAERLDGNNGLLLAPHIDHLFDYGYISFENDGTLLISRKLDASTMKSWGVKSGNYGTFNAKQMRYLQYHRKHVFKV
jgi:hypothetical protein